MANGNNRNPTADILSYVEIMKLEKFGNIENKNKIYMHLQDFYTYIIEDISLSRHVFTM